MVAPLELARHAGQSTNSTPANGAPALSRTTPVTFGGGSQLDLQLIRRAGFKFDRLL